MPTQANKPWRRGTNTAPTAAGGGSAGGPLTSICVPQDRGGTTSRLVAQRPNPSSSDPNRKLGAATSYSSAVAAESVKILSVPVVLDASSRLLDQDQASFDLMEIQLTVYGLTGVVATKKDKKTKKKEGRKTNTSNNDRRQTSGPSRLFSKRQQPQQSSSSTSTSSTLDAVSNSRIGNNSEDVGYDTPIDDGVPVTAVVSLRRNAISSSTSLETFLPSLPLAVASAVEVRPGSSYRYQASWMTPRTGAGVRTAKRHAGDEDADACKDACTFKVMRAMRREGYRPGLSVDDVGNYACETIELPVWVGHRRELVPLGTASLVVTGDEEGEHVMKVPVRPPPQALTKGRKGKSSMSFSHAPNWWYSLEENSALRVGVKVVPVPAGRDENVRMMGEEEAPIRSKPSRRRSKPAKGKPDFAAPSRKDVILELEDEAALMAQLCRTDDDDESVERKKEKSSPLSSSTSSESEARKEPGPTMNSLNCSAGVTSATSSPGLALMTTLLPAGMFCVPTSAYSTASCLDHAVQPHTYQPSAPKKDLDTFLRSRSRRPAAKAQKSKPPVASAKPPPVMAPTAAPHLSSSLLSTLSGSTDGSQSVTEAEMDENAKGGGSRAAAASFADSHLLSVQKMIEENLRVMHAKLKAGPAPGRNQHPPPHERPAPAAGAATFSVAAAAGSGSPPIAPQPPPARARARSKSRGRRPGAAPSRTLEV